MRWHSHISRAATAVLGAVVGAVVGGFVVVCFTLVLKAGIDFASRQSLAYILIAPALGLAVATFVLHGLGTGAVDGRMVPHRWRTFHPEAIRADISGEIVDSAGEE